MSEQLTENTRYATISQQVPALQGFAALVQMFPELPAAHLTVHAYAPAEMWAQPDTAAGVEAWRVALQVPPASVILRRYASYCSIEFEGAVCGVIMRVFTSTDLAPDRATRSPAEDAEYRRAAALIEQRHQVEDAAVPPLASAEPAAVAAAVMPLAEMTGGAV
jgi:hypothetical protein